MNRVSNKYDLVIEAGKSESHYWRNIWRYRELFVFFAWRDILVRYKQTVFGIAWSIIRPLLSMIIFTIIFGKIAKLPSDGTAYPVLVYAAMLPWMFFASSLTAISNSLIGNVNLISKIYFPRIIIPTSTIIVNLVDFAISFAIYIILMIIYNVKISWHIFSLPLFLLLAMLAVIGSGLLIAAMNVKYRDFKYIVPFIVQLGMYISPVGFSSSVVPEKWRLLYSINPMVGVIDGFRWALLGGQVKIYLPGILISIILTMILCIAGIKYFRSTEQSFADVI